MYLYGEAIGSEPPSRTANGSLFIYWYTQSRVLVSTLYYPKQSIAMLYRTVLIGGVAEFLLRPHKLLFQEQNAYTATVDGGSFHVCL